MTKAFVFLVGVSGLLIVSSLLLGAAIVLHPRAVALVAAPSGRAANGSATSA